MNPDITFSHPFCIAYFFAAYRTKRWQNSCVLAPDHGTDIATRWRSCDTRGSERQEETKLVGSHPGTGPRAYTRVGGAMCEHDDGNGQIYRFAGCIDCGWGEECNVSGTYKIYFGFGSKGDLHG